MREEFGGVVLRGQLVRLEPLSRHHLTDLAIAAEEDRSEYGFTWVPRGSEVEDYLDAQFERAATGRLTPFAQIRVTDDRAVGCTAYWDPRCWPGRSALCAIEIGFTWLGASAQGTGLNTEAKLLMLEHAFERLGVVRVDLKTDARNVRSRRAIEGSARISRVYCGTGRNPGLQAKMATYVTPRCIP
jgi:N-acetyltransferase